MNSLSQQLHHVQQNITHFCHTYQRDVNTVQLLAVSKTRSATDILKVFQQGQTRFGENYIQEAVEKITTLTEYPIEWHFIGRIQSNKTQLIAQHFSWVHSLDSLKHANRLNNQRGNLVPLNCCIQINIDQTSSKGGITPEQIPQWLEAFHEFKHLSLRGFMCIPAPTKTLDKQRTMFRHMNHLLHQYHIAHPNLDTLSMGMSNDMEAAIAEGANIVRIGTAIFGSRN